MNPIEGPAMAFVHSLVKIGTGADLVGWCAPLELGEAAPHYINFVVPVAENHDFFDNYLCEMITTVGDDKEVKAYELIRRGRDSFSLRYGRIEVWFAERPGSKHLRRLPYVGKLGHEDFRHQFAEIEPADAAALDRLYDEHGTFIIGCEPFVHYENIDNRLAIGSSPGV